MTGDLDTITVLGSMLSGGSRTDLTGNPMIDEAVVKEKLRLKGQYLYHREGQELEFKEQFNFAGLAEYFRDFAGFANNRGGLIIFGVTDSPRAPKGLSESAEKQFTSIDSGKLDGFLLDVFSPTIRWEAATVTVSNRTFGVFLVHEAELKPVIAKKDEGRDGLIQSGAVFFRYAGRTQRIKFAELEAIIDRRVERANQQWLDLMSKIARIGPQSAAVLDTERGLVEKDDSQILMLDESLVRELNFISEGQFNERDGAPAYKIVGSVVPIDTVEVVVKKVRENLLREYPLSARELADEVKNRLPDVGTNAIWRAISDNGMKRNPDYAAFIFRNKKQEDAYRRSGFVPPGLPSIYNSRAVEFLVNVLGDG